MHFTKLTFLMLICTLAAGASANSLPKTVKKIKPSIVGVGIYDPIGSPRNQLHGTGFAIANGYYIATNYHVVGKGLKGESKQSRIVFIGTGSHPKISHAEIVASDPAHDLAILLIKDKVPALLLMPDDFVDEGIEVAFTGFPIGSVLGLYPATHKGLISALTPVAIPSINANQLSIEMLKRLRKPFFIYQMDATAYPGNSGSPVYTTDTGEVLGIINKVFVKQTKEKILSDPSDISYSIPIKHLRALARSISIDI
ncbi:serine protease [Alteromonadaceae bacterium BrNp21-10]|nr:serine protease [Alteromonadaceae bacterium BrNp21-10]